jgi:hypothetical protein
MHQKVFRSGDRIASCQGWGRFSTSRAVPLILLWLLPVALTALCALLVSAQQSGAPPTPFADSGQNSETPATRVLPRGKKLFLKDGSFQLVREYQIQGDRVRYYSLDSGSWEFMPADLVDWDATKKVELEEAKLNDAMNAKAQTQEAARVVAPLDIDASLEVAPGVFLPPGVNLFVFDGKSVLPVSQAQTSAKVSKRRLLEQVLIPVPIVPSRQNISIQGAHAKFRLQNSRPEFYLRTADSREPNLDLIRAKPHGDSRLIEHLDELMGEKAAMRDALPLQKWQVAQGVYRFTLGQVLAPGEYALAQILDEEGMSLFVWDFGVDTNASATGTR